jgi:hypothetical protein
MTPGFTPEQRRAIGAYVRAIADALLLRDWRFELPFDPPPSPNAFAQVRPVYGRRIAQLWFCRDFADLEPEKIRHVVTHELLHVVTDQITSTLENAGERLVGAPAFAVLWEATRERSEQATDQLADALAPHLPLIDWNVVDAGDVVWTETLTEPPPTDLPG